MLYIIWEFRVKKDKVEEFEKHYSSTGTWAAFFRKSPAYVRTELWRGVKHDRHYVTLDVWKDLESYENFRHESGAEYHKIDQGFDKLTDEEKLVGYFDSEWQPFSAAKV